MLRQRVDVAPVLGESPLERGDRLLAGCDVCFQPFELGWPRRFRPGLSLRTLLLFRLLRLRRGRRVELLALADIVGPPAVVRVEMSSFAGGGGLGDPAPGGAG